MPREIDAAKPEERPDVFVFGHCSQCTGCFLDLRTGRCSCAGPYDANLEYQPRGFIHHNKIPLRQAP